MSDIVAALQEVVGKDRLMLQDKLQSRALSFWNDAPTVARALALPRSTDEVARLMQICRKFGQCVVTQGGRTNCVAAAEPDASDVVISLEKMNRIEEIDVVGGVAIVESGVVLQSLQEAAAAAGLFFPLDLGARGSCTIGGNVATNAGGINVLRYGMMRSLVLGLEAVLADGTVVSSMNRMLKNNAGYDLKQLFIGSEGTLGIVTRAALRLYPQPLCRQNALLAMDSFEQVTQFLTHMQQRMAGTLCAYEIMWGDYYAAVTAEGGHRAPLRRDYPLYVVLQTEGASPSKDAEYFESVLTKALEGGLIVDAVIPKSDAEVRDIWAIRENFEAILEPAPMYLYDVSLPIAAMPDYVQSVRDNVLKRWKNAYCYTIGHVADGNLHIFVLPCEADVSRSDVDPYVYDPLRQIGGSVSAEHGIGTEKMAWLEHSRSQTEVELMRQLKRSLDPDNRLNPGRIFALSAARA